MKKKTPNEQIKAEIEQIEMVLVEGGTFIMGKCNPAWKSHRFATNSEPAHSVTLSSFYIGKYPVTQKQWRDIVQWKQGDKGGSLRSDPSCHFHNDNFPVTHVSWNQIQKWLTYLNKREGLSKSPHQYRLPTEAEWEFAARGGNKSQGYLYSGSNNIDDVADRKPPGTTQGEGEKYHELFNYPRRAAGVLRDVEPKEVGAKRSNELGIFNMTGFVSEWCNDWYAPYTEGAQTDPKGPAKGRARILRGGEKSLYSRCPPLIYRQGDFPSRWARMITWLYFYGFRVARTA